jgi:hypothetical protein
LSFSNQIHKHNKKKTGHKKEPGHIVCPGSGSG